MLIPDDRCWASDRGEQGVAADVPGSVHFLGLRFCAPKCKSQPWLATGSPSIFPPGFPGGRHPTLRVTFSVPPGLLLDQESQGSTSLVDVLRRASGDLRRTPCASRSSACAHPVSSLRGAFLALLPRAPGLQQREQSWVQTQEAS